MQKTGNELTYDYDFYALNGLLSFLRLIQEEGGKKVWCQRPKRASFISTDTQDEKNKICKNVSTP